jgi:hypothetical protein
MSTNTNPSASSLLSLCVKKKSDTETTNEGKSGEDFAIKRRDRDEGRKKAE